MTPRERAREKRRERWLLELLEWNGHDLIEAWRDLHILQNKAIDAFFRDRPEEREQFEQVLKQQADAAIQERVNEAVERMLRKREVA